MIFRSFFLGAICDASLSPESTYCSDVGLCGDFALRVYGDSGGSLGDGAQAVLRAMALGVDVWGDRHFADSLDCQDGLGGQYLGGYLVFDAGTRGI
jgi:hypothetical protein